MASNTHIKKEYIPSDVESVVSCIDNTIKTFKENPRNYASEVLKHKTNIYDNIPTHSTPTLQSVPWKSPDRRKRTVSNEHQYISNIKPTKTLKLTESIYLPINDIHETPFAPIYYPTIEEFADPIGYITSIQEEAEEYGICKIVPPHGWNPNVSVNVNDDKIYFETRLQNIHNLQLGKPYNDGKRHTFKSYQEQANEFRNIWLSLNGLTDKTATSSSIEEGYWRILENGYPNICVEYANDLDTTVVGSGFPRSDQRAQNTPRSSKEKINFSSPEYYKNTDWNLNNLPYAKGSLLRYVQTAIKGINVPWLYSGMLFATFCWHTEDNHMYSANYQHYGAPKRWYGIPASQSNDFETILRERMPERFIEEPDLLHHLTTMVPPSVLIAKGVNVYTLIQKPGEYVLTFPRAYHAGFSEGFNINEASNFVLPRWIKYSRNCIEHYRDIGRHSIFSHDHFIFHLASSQKLAEFSFNECEMLVRELRTMYHEEKQLQTTLLENTELRNILETSADLTMNDRSMDLDEMRQCFHCKHHVFYSGVTCICEPWRLSCLRHVKIMCSCTLAHRTLIRWVNSAELRFAIKRVQQIMQSLKSPSN